MMSVIIYFFLCLLSYGSISRHWFIFTLSFMFSLRFFQYRQVCAQEAAARLLSIPMHGKSRQVKYLDTAPADRRCRRVKNKTELKSLADDASPFFSNFVTDHYPNRSNKLEHLCLYELFKWYNYAPQKECEHVRVVEKGKCTVCFPQKNGNGMLKKRQKFLIPKTRKLTIKDEQREEYFRQILMLFKPYRDESELKGSFASFEEAYRAADASVRTNAEAYIEPLHAITEAITEDKKVNQEEPGEDNDGVSSEDELPNSRVMTTEQFEAATASLNAGQKEVFEYVTAKLSKTKMPLRLFISGVGGTGKSYLINTIKQYCRRELEEDEDSPSVIVVAPTGIAAFNVNGSTIHRTFHIPVARSGAASYTPMSEDKLKMVRNQLRSLKLIIVDEISMVSNVLLEMIEQRLTETFNLPNQTRTFGGVNIVVLGDLFQLPPVGIPNICGTVFQEMSPKIAARSFNTSAVLPRALWKEFRFMELLTNQRQKDDRQWSSTLNRIRLAEHTEADVKLLETRLVTKLYPDKFTIDKSRKKRLEVG